MTDPAPPRPAVTRRQLLLGGSLLSVGLLACGTSLHNPLAHSSPDTPSGTFPVTHTDAEWRQLLNPQQYQILREAGTEQPFSSPLDGESVSPDGAVLNQSNKLRKLDASIPRGRGRRRPDPNRKVAQ